MSPTRALRRLAAACAFALVGLAVLAAWPGPVSAGPGGWRSVAPADTDSVAVPALEDAAPARDTTDLEDGDPGGAVLEAAADTVEADSAAAPEADAPSALEVAADTAEVDTTARARAYFPVPTTVGASASLLERRVPGVRGRLGQYWRRQVTLDTTALAYTVTEEVAGVERAPAQLSLAEFLEVRQREAVGDQFRTLSAQRANRRDQQRRGGGIGIAVDIPGGNESAFTTLFGKNEVALTVNGTSNVNLGFRYDQNDIQQSINRNASALAPDFGQELNLNVAGTIGDKLAINVNYDTQSQFDFENQVSLVYTGYDDDIVQRIEAGNVFLQTPATLIRGGQRLFGLRTDLQFGPLALTAVASQQDAESTESVFEGGSDAQRFAIAPFEYEEDTHFFLGYAFHNWWDRAHVRPNNPELPPGFRRIIGLEVWKHEPRLINAIEQDLETTWAVALADLGEPPAVLEGGEAYLGGFVDGRYENEAAPLPAPDRDQYSPGLIEQIRAGGDGSTLQSINAQLSEDLSEQSVSRNIFKRLTANVDYTFDPNLGWLSLSSQLTDSDLLAVAYQYEDLSGNIVTVGDYARAAQSASQNGPRTVLKLIRPRNPAPDDALWDLSLRNVYRIGGRSLNASTFELDVTYEASGASASPVPRDISFDGDLTFLEVLGLDRINQQGTTPSDNTFDFIERVTIEPASGRVIFPVRQPFGDYLENVIKFGRTVGTVGSGGDVVNVNFGALTEQQALDLYVPTQVENGERQTLYDLLPENARRRLPRLSAYRIEGEYKSATQSTFNIGFQIVEGTVRVTAGDIELTENVDYQVNYTGGTVEITNPQYLLQGQRIRVEAEQQDFFSIGSKTLVGMRADYRLSEDFNLGATWMRLNERPLGDKFRLGEEALSNTIVGFDGAFLAEPRWLTRAVDALPLVQTRAPSRIDIRGEVARLNPGSPQTLAFDRARDGLRDADLDFDADEIAGISYVDDFEGSENAFTGLRFVNGWRLAAPPTNAGPPGAVAGTASSDVTDPALRTSWRGLFTWYSLSRTDYRDVFPNIATPASEEVPVNELFPERQFARPSDGREPLDLLDLYFDPTRRGPYNFNGQLSSTFEQNPTDVWGGFVRQIESSYSNFDGQNNIEFVEILVSPLGGKDGTEPIRQGAVLHVDLGRINEDVLPNGFLNLEDGLPDSDAVTDVDSWSRRAGGGRSNGFVNVFEESQRTEDLGLDGIPSEVSIASDTEPYGITEAEQFGGFLSTLPDGPERRRSQRDPSGDDYVYYLDERYNDTSLYPSLPEGATVQERFANYWPATELNSAVARDQLADGNGVSLIPNTEDINGNNSLDVQDAFHRYTVPLDAGGIAASPFFLNTLTTKDQNENLQTWYLLRIPIRTQEREPFGGIDDDFSRIEAVRVWTTGHDKPATLRIASFELVGSQWLKSETVGEVELEDEPGAVGGMPPQLFVSTINNEENASIYAIPRGTVQNVARSVNGNAVATREQALVFRAEGLADGRRAGLVRSYATRPLDLTKYSNLRVDVHGDGFERSDSMLAFVRFGDDETENYYEIEQPVYPFDPDRLSEFDGDQLRFAKCPNAASGDVPSNCVRSDSLWQTNVMVNGERVDLNPINVVLSRLNEVKLERDRAITDGSARDVADRFTVPAGEDAPAGSRITVRGQPSIQDVRTVVLGVRNGPGGAAVVDTVSLWFNELRVTGYDEAGGASGFVTANVVLADLASVNARLSFTQDGFGDLGGALGGRNFAEQNAFTLTSQLSAHKLLPERYGWNIPVSLSLTRNESTPRFDPDNGDVRLADLVDAARTDGDAEGTIPGGDIRANEILERARTETSSTNVRVSATKTGSRSPWLRYTVDGVTASYSLSAQDGRNPTSAVSTQNSWTGNVAYRVAVPRPLAVRPFWLLGGVPIARDVLGGLRLNLLPQNASFSADASRSLSATQPRLGAEFLGQPDSVNAFRALTRRTQRFQHGRQANVQYTPFPFLQLSYASDTDQDLGGAGQDEQFKILVRERNGGFAREYDLSPNDARSTADTSVVFRDLVANLDSLEFGDPFPSDRVEILGGSDLEVFPLGQALGNVFGGDFRTRSYSQRATASLRVSTQRLAWLRWLQLQPISYSADYDWRDQPSAAAPELDIASAGARTSVQSSVKVLPRTFWRLFPFYRAMERSAGRNVPGQPRAVVSESDSSSGGFRPLGLARDVFLAATAVDDVTLTYRGSATAATGGLEGQSFSLLSGLAGSAPPLGYRLGLTNRLDPDRRVTDDAAFNTFSDLLGTQHDIDARTQLSPIRGLSIGLSWRTAWSESEEVDFQIPAGGGDLIESFGRRAGTGTSTVLGFGGSYDGLVGRQVDRFQRDVAGATADTVQTEFLSPTGLADDFSAEFGRGMGAFGPNGIYALPLPNWTVTYSGLERLPLLNKLANQISLQHGYSSTSEARYATLFDPEARISRFGLEDGTAVTLAGEATLAENGYDEPTAVTVNERFQPLIGVTLGLKGNVQASFSTNRTSLLTLQAISSQVYQRTSQDLRVDLSYSKRGLRLFGLRGVNNDIRFQLTALVASDATETRPFENDVLARLDADPENDDLVSDPVATSRLQVSPQISYTVSNQVTANLIAQYDRTYSEAAGTTNRFTGGVTLRILFSN